MKDEIIGCLQLPSFPVKHSIKPTLEKPFYRSCPNKSITINHNRSTYNRATLRHNSPVKLSLLTKSLLPLPKQQNISIPLEQLLPLKRMLGEKVNKQPKMLLSHDRISQLLNEPLPKADRESRNTFAHIFSTFTCKNNLTETTTSIGTNKTKSNNGNTKYYNQTLYNEGKRNSLSCEQNRMLMEIIKKAGEYVFDDGSIQFNSKSERKRYIDTEKEMKKLKQLLRNSPNKREAIATVQHYIVPHYLQVKATSTQRISGGVYQIH